MRYTSPMLTHASAELEEVARVHPVETSAEKEPPATRDVAHVVGAAVGGGSAHHLLPTKMPAFKRGVSIAATTGLSGIAGDRLTRPILEKQGAAWTPEKMHTLADSLGIPWNDDKHFMDFSEEVVGVRHLDDMSSKQLEALAGALLRVCIGAEKAGPTSKAAPPTGIPHQAQPE